MKYSKTTLMELNHKYSKILRKCAILNAAILMSVVASSTNAATLNYGDEMQDGGWLLVYRITDGTYTHDAENAVVTVTPSEDNKITAQNFWTSIQSHNDAHKHPIINVVGDENTVLNMTANENDWLVVSRFSKVNVGTESSPIGILNMTDTVLEPDGGSLIYVTAGNNYSDASQQDLKIYGNKITMTAKKTDGTAGPAITGNEGKMTLVSNETLTINGNIEGYNSVYGGHSDMTFNINQNSGNKAVTKIVGDINAAKGSVVNIGLKGDNSSVTGNMLVSADGSQLPGGSISLSFGKNGKITGNITAQDQGKISVSGDDMVAIAGNITVDNQSEFSGSNVALTGALNNAGTVNFGNVLDLSNGSLVNAGTITFASGSSLKAALNGSTVIAGTTGVISGTTNLVLDNAKDGDSIVLEGDKSGFTFADNALFNIDFDDADTYTISKKSADQVAEELAEQGVDSTAAETIGAVAQAGSDNAAAKAISEAVQSGDLKTAEQAAKDLAPTTSDQVMGIAKDVTKLLADVTTARMAPVGASGGDVFQGGGVWVQGLYNRSKQDSTSTNEGFKANTRGIAMGLDGKLSDAMTVGIGYGYTDTSADAGNRDVDVAGHHVFLYGQYQPSSWYANWLLDYGYSKYDEEKSPMGVKVKAKYHVNSYAANLMTGYQFWTGFAPEAGFRYLLVDQGSYNDGVQHVKSDKNDVLTGLAGVRFVKAFDTDTATFTPHANVALTYDFISDGSKANVEVLGGGNYQIRGKRLHRFGVEAGAGVTMTMGSWDLSADYRGGFRKDFGSHTGMLKAKYNF